MRWICKIFQSLIIFCFLMQFSACDCFFGSEQPSLSYENGRYLYQGKKYILTDKIEFHKSLGADLYFNYSELIAVATVSNGILPNGTAYVSDFDEKNICLLIQAPKTKTGVWVEENFKVPNAYESEFEQIILEVDVDDSKRICIPLTQDETIYDIIESEPCGVQIYGDQEIGVRCFFTLKEHVFLMTGNYYLINVDENVYLAPMVYFTSQGDSSLIYNVEYYKIKDEYQEAFKTAIENLKAKENISAE